MLESTAGCTAASAPCRGQNPELRLADLDAVLFDLDGVRHVLADRGITLPEGGPTDGAGCEAPPIRLLVEGEQLTLRPGRLIRHSLRRAGAREEGVAGTDAGRAADQGDTSALQRRTPVADPFTEHQDTPRRSNPWQPPPTLCAA